MIKKMQWEWEKLDEGTYRAKVMGGWLILHTNSLAVNDGKKRDVSMSESMVFIPDSYHEWTIVTPKADPKIERSAIAKDFDDGA